MLEGPSHCGVGLTLWRRVQKKEGRVGRIFDHSNVFRKFCQGQWGVLEPKSPSARPMLTELSIFVMLRHRLGQALGMVAQIQHGSEFRAQQLGPSVSCMQHSRRSEMRMLTTEGSRQMLVGGKV